MKLQNLRISEIPSYMLEAGNYEGEITYANEKGKIQLNLSSEQVARILPILADALIESSKEVANNLTAAVIEQSAKLLEISHD
jgi:hypothetical protein